MTKRSRSEGNPLCNSESTESALGANGACDRPSTRETGRLADRPTGRPTDRPTDCKSGALAGHFSQTPTAKVELCRGASHIIRLQGGVLLIRTER